MTKQFSILRLFVSVLIAVYFGFAQLVFSLISFFQDGAVGTAFMQAMLACICFDYARFCIKDIRVSKWEEELRND